VSRLFPDRIGISLAPESVAWVVMRRGLRNHLHANGITKIAAQDGRTWQQAVQTLQSGLLLLPVTKGKVTVVVSNAFVRYLLVNGGKVLSGDEDRMALARHDFLKVYGGVAENWEIRISASDGGGKFLAGAADAGLIEELRKIFSATGFTLDSIQPYFALAFDAWCTKLDSKTSHGILLSEAGGYCYAGIGSGEWQFMRTGRWEENDPVKTFQRVIDREVFLSGATQRALWWCPAHDKEFAKVLGNVKDAHPLPGSEALQDMADPEYALALAGAA
jgi:hypothetical protein